LPGFFNQGRKSAGEGETSMKLRWLMGWALCVAGVLSTATVAVERSDLSADAQAFLPDERILTVKLKNGFIVRGERQPSSPDTLSLKVTEGSITTRKIYATQDVTIVAVNIGRVFADELKKLQLSPDAALPRAEYARRLLLFDEFFTKFPDYPEGAELKSLRQDTAAELEQVKKGLEKVDTRWMLPVEGAIFRFRGVTSRMRELTKQYPGVEKASYTAQPKVRKGYEQLLEQRRAIARSLAGVIRERLPLLLAQGEIDSATTELNAFLNFWLERVMKNEAEAADRALFGETPFESMDFSLITGLARRIIGAAQALPPRPLPAGVTPPPGMVYVPGGYALMGREDAKPNEPDFPLRVVYVKPFFMDRCEVANADYRKFVEQARTSGDVSMEHPLSPPMKNHDALGWKTPALSRDDQPVVGVDWFDAYAYAKAAGKRLPTEAEWECAARGGDDRIYSWGDLLPGQTIVSSPGGRKFLATEMDRQMPLPAPRPPSRGIFGCLQRKEPPLPPPHWNLPVEPWDADQLLPPQAIGKLEWNEDLAGPYGLLHLAGNAAEWVNDWYSPTAYVTNIFRDPPGPIQGTVHVFRGGSYLSADDTKELRVFTRGIPVNDNMKKGCFTDARPMIGFRCVKDLDAPLRP
jgi:formylglycine-generating enzyme required for sulfatase activity